MTDDTTLAQLLSRVALQDRAALRALYEAVAGRLLAIAHRMLGDHGAAEDMVQDTFITVWTRAAQFPALRTSPLAWLTSIARHRAIDVMRRRRPEEPLHWQDADGRARHHDARDDSATALQQMLACEAEGRLGQCMSQLDTEPRAAVMLAYFEGLTHEELAAQLQRS